MTTHLGSLSWKDIPDVPTGSGPAEIATLAARPELRQPVADIHERIYRDQHAWSPVGVITHEFKESVFLDPDELIAEAQFIALLNEHVVGISSLRAPFSIREPDLGWIGIIDELPNPTAEAIHAQLLDECLRLARNEHADIFMEIDESDRRTLASFRNLKVRWEADWLNLVWRDEEARAS